jgi:hypothetical protein
MWQDAQKPDQDEDPDEPTDPEDPTIPEFEFPMFPNDPLFP